MEKWRNHVSENLIANRSVYNEIYPATKSYQEEAFLIQIYRRWFRHDILKTRHKLHDFTLLLFKEYYCNL